MKRTFTKYPSNYVKASMDFSSIKCKYCGNKISDMEKDIGEKADTGEVACQSNTVYYVECPGCGGKTCYKVD